PRRNTIACWATLRSRRVTTAVYLRASSRYFARRSGWLRLRASADGARSSSPAARTSSSEASSASPSARRLLRPSLGLLRGTAVVLLQLVILCERVRQAPDVLQGADRAQAP